MERSGFKSVFWIGLGAMAGVLFLGSCGPRGFELARGVQPSQVDPLSGSKAQRRIQARTLARNATLKCTLEGECEPAVALITVVTDEGLERCSGVLISDQEVLTNDHCINKSVSLIGWSTRNRKLPCKGSVYAHFAGDETRSDQHAECFQIEYRSGESGINSQDYAIIKLDHPIQDRSPLKISKRGFRDRESARILRVQMDRGEDGEFGGSQNFLSCSASHATFLYPLLNSMDSPLMTFGDCTIQSGNSGSPILNEDGELGGIVQGYLTLKQESDLERELQEQLLDDSFGLVGIGSQARCMGDLNPSSSPSCTSVPPFTNFYPKVYLDIVGKFDESILPALSNGDEWTSVSVFSSNLKRYFSKPACLKNQEFDSFEMNYKKGINHALQAEWRSQNNLGEKREKFSAKEISPFGGTTCASADGTLIEVPACR